MGLLPYLNNSIVIQSWRSTSTYSMYDVTAGIYTGNNLSTLGPLTYSTIDGNLGNNPSGSFIYPITAYSRSQDMATVTLAVTGSFPQFARGSQYAITGLGDIQLNATGMVLNVVGSGASSVVLQFVNPGPPVSAFNVVQGALNCPEPSWTTGFFWTPAYSTQWEVQQAVINVQFENGYSQRSPQGLAPNTNIWSLVFTDRSDTETKGIMAYVQNLAGVYSTPLLIPPSRLYNNPSIKYVLSNPRVNEKSYNLNDIQVVARQVFEY